jgi:hypothetical protein
MAAHQARAVAIIAKRKQIRHFQPASYAAMAGASMAAIETNSPVVIAQSNQPGQSHLITSSQDS